MSLPCIDGTLRRHSDNAIVVRGVKSGVQSVIMNTSQMRISVYNRSGVEVPGQTWPTAGTYVENSDGDYYAVIEEDINWEFDIIYKVVIELEDVNDLVHRVVRHYELQD